MSTKNSSTDVFGTAVVQAISTKLNVLWVWLQMSSGEVPMRVWPWF